MEKTELHKLMGVKIQKNNVLHQNERQVRSSPHLRVCYATSHDVYFNDFPERL